MRIRIIAQISLTVALSISILAPALAAPDDVVPAGSAIYDALAILASHHRLADPRLSAAAFEGITGQLYTRDELSKLVQGVAASDSIDSESQQALEFARTVLGLGPTDAKVKSQPAVGGFTELSLGSRDAGNVFSSLILRGRVLGAIGRDGAYTIGVTNEYSRTDARLSFNTRSNGMGGLGNPDALDGIDEAYVTGIGTHGVRASVGLIRRRWGSGWRGDLLISDNTPAHPSFEVQVPLHLGPHLGDYNLTQFISTYQNQGHTVYLGARRLEHKVGDRVELSAEESFVENEFKRSTILILPFYAYQKSAYASTDEPNYFNYNANIGIQIRPIAHNDNSRIYGQFFIDDIKAPKGLGQKGLTPRKIGYMLGIAQRFTATGTQAVVEFAHMDRETYTKPLTEQAPLAWFANDLPIGHPIGPNGKELFVRLSQRLSPKLDVAAEFLDRQRVTQDFPAPVIKYLDLKLAYAASATSSVGLNIGEYHEDAYSGVYVDPFTGVPGPIDTGGGADYGQTIRDKVLEISLIHAF